MNRGIRLALLGALVVGTSCRRPPDPRQLAELDHTITVVQAASLTLNELGPDQFLAADSILTATRPLFLQRFKDTLDRPTAELLGDQFLSLRQASEFRTEQDRIRNEVERTMIRLQALRTDLVKGAMRKEDGRAAIDNEERAFGILNTQVEQMLEHHKAIRRVLQRQAEVDSLLAAPEPIHPRR
ncbi:MAG: hypothetical protein IPL64_06265 [Flavobacteriales bacterium]|nr:hypothetical protein [Flavobacteriales bacterium]MBP8877984.1 hypothetical protein [Flavobacteriales bacterium]